MGIFGKSRKDKKIENLETEVLLKNVRIEELENLCEEKDDYFKEVISDATRHGSKLGAKHLSDRKKHLKENK